MQSIVKRDAVAVEARDELIIVNIKKAKKGGCVAFLGSIGAKKYA